MAVVKNGTSIYDIKEFFTEQIAPKYFKEIENLNDLNIGLYGYITEILADTTKDSYFAISSLFKEMFPTEAELPESIYNHALLYQLNNIFATPAQVNFYILIAEDSVISNGTPTGNTDDNMTQFNIDSDIEFLINGIPFMLDYDVKIISKLYGNTYRHAAQYIIESKNDVSKLNDPFIRTSTFINENKKRYILLDVNLHQVEKKIVTDTIISNDRINLVTLDYKFDNQLANFEVFYKAPGESVYIQLKKLPENSAIIDEEFCFYKLTDENKLQLSFSPDNMYFQPKYNSDIYVVLYTTLGSKGNFDIYQGSQVEVVGKSSKYSNNLGVVFLGTVNGAAVNGKDILSLEELKNEVIKARSTVKVFNTSNDLNLFFNEYTEYSKSKILFMKKRDDVFERLYSAFVLFKDNKDGIIPTNSLDVILNPKDIALTIEQEHRNIIKAGKLYKYYNTGIDQYTKVFFDNNKEIYLYNDLDIYEGYKDDNAYEFLYINPFLMVLCTDPINVSFYLNSVDISVPVTMKTSNEKTFNQFIIYNIDIYRDAILEKYDYLSMKEKSLISESNYNKLILDDIDSVIDSIPLQIDELADDNTTYKISNPKVESIVKYTNSSYTIPTNNNRYKEILNEFKNKLARRDDYIIKVKLEPTSILEQEAFTLVKDDTLVKDSDITFINFNDNKLYINNNNLKVMVELYGSDNNPKAYIPLELYGFDKEYYYFSARIKTDDYINKNNNLKIIDGFIPIDNTHDNEYIMIPGFNSFLKIYVFYKPIDPIPQTHDYIQYNDLEYFILTNSYSLIEDNLISFITPIQEIRSYIDYEFKEKQSDTKFGYRIDSIPLIKANYFKIDENKKFFIDSFNSIYKYLDSALDQLTNNFKIDLKFFNTYGPSNHYYIIKRDENNPLLKNNKLIDKVNISLEFDVKYNIITNKDLLTDQISEYIKKFIENHELSIVSAPNFYISKLMTECTENFDGLKYMIFKGINKFTSEVQALESDVNESNIIHGIIQTNDIIPEFLNVDMIIKNGVTTPQIKINVL